ncbi:MAG: fatty acid desaturase [Flammeovirgaceae bacterium]|nr:fatty acid desaturase [Flammeovirgaceae bacterium]|tara:strand:+ start:1465 stop:2244 length:780 start_codon:yes stop_codon:yes gene_type:complete
MLTLLTFCLIYYFIAGIVIVLGYHRCLTHKAFKMRKWFEYVVVVLGLPAGTPIQWVGNHRFHHANPDLSVDPHSPIIHGFWYAHNGWYINSKIKLLCFLYALAGPIRFLIDAWNRPRTNQEHNHLAKDISADPFYRYISSPSVYAVLMLLHSIIPFGFAYALWEINGFITLWINLIIIFNLGDSINSLGHEKINEHSSTVNRNVLAFFTFGDGYHKDHHQNPGVARVGFQSKQIDLGWRILLILKFLNLVYDINTLEEQ